MSTLTLLCKKKTEKNSKTVYLVFVLILIYFTENVLKSWPELGQVMGSILSLGYQLSTGCTSVPHMLLIFSQDHFPFSSRPLLSSHLIRQLTSLTDMHLLNNVRITCSLLSTIFMKETENNVWGKQRHKNRNKIDLEQLIVVMERELD